MAESCDQETHYEREDGQCCKMCDPGTRMKLNTDCLDPSCEECESSEYMDTYTKDNVCKVQPYCDPNLNFLKQNNPSTKSRSICKCKPDHHCSSSFCDSCVRNKICQAGEKVKKNGTQNSDTECEPCPEGSFSSQNSSFTCQPWTECKSGYVESFTGTSSSDRICACNKTLIIIVVIVIMFLLLLGIVFVLYMARKRGSLNFTQTVHKCGLVFKDNNQQYVKDQLHTETEDEPEVEEQPNQPVEEVYPPQENQDEEEQIKLDASLKPGVSENGQPVIQDHSKSLLISQPETNLSDNYSMFM